LTFIHKWSNADGSHRKKLLGSLPVQIYKARGAFLRLNSLVRANRDRFSQNDLEVMNKIYKDAIILSQQWSRIVDDNEKIESLLTLIETARLLKKLKA